jgi:hypothetical protein
MVYLLQIKERASFQVFSKYLSQISMKREETFFWFCLGVLQEGDGIRCLQPIMGSEVAKLLRRKSLPKTKSRTKLRRNFKNET